MNPKYPKSSGSSNETPRVKLEGKSHKFELIACSVVFSAQVWNDRKVCFAKPKQCALLGQTTSLRNDILPCHVPPIGKKMSLTSAGRPKPQNYPTRQHCQLSSNLASLPYDCSEVDRKPVSEIQTKFSSRMAKEQRVFPAFSVKTDPKGH